MRYFESREPQALYDSALFARAAEALWIEISSNERAEIEPMTTSSRNTPTVFTNPLAVEQLTGTWQGA